jgi:hypothetical protein
MTRDQEINANSSGPAFWKNASAGTTFQVGSPTVDSAIIASLVSQTGLSFAWDPRSALTGVECR